MMQTRRAFLLSSTALVAAILITGGAASHQPEGPFGPWLAQVLRKHLPGHALDAAGLQRFIAAYTSEKADASWRLDALALASRITDLVEILPGGAREKLVAEERRIVTAFLMNSDFFAEPTPPRTVTYAGQSLPCANYLARF